MKTTICCISDSHLGYRHKMKQQRLRDYEDSFKDALSRAMALEPEILIFGGDLVHHTRPEPKSMHTVLKTLMEIADSTQVVMCIGNHEIEGHLGSAYTPIFSDLHKNIHVLTTENPHITIKVYGKRIGIHGFQYLRDRKLAEKTLRRISDEIPGYGDVNILCMHQAIEHYLSPFEISIKVLREVAPRFDLILSGHVHRHQKIMEISDLTPGFYIGSTERISFNEWQNPNGFLVFRNLDFKNPEFVRINSASMKRISKDIGRKTPAEINSYIEELIKENLNQKCLQININAEIQGDYFDIRHDWETLFREFTILDVNVIPRMGEDEIKIKRFEINSSVIDEYFEKSGMKDRKELKELCVELFKKYSGG